MLECGSYARFLLKEIVIFLPDWLGARLILVNSGKRAREKNEGMMERSLLQEFTRQAAGQEKSFLRPSNTARN